MQLSAPLSSTLPLSVPHRWQKSVSASSLLLSRPFPTASTASASRSSTFSGCSVARLVRASATREEEWSAAVVSDDAVSERKKASLLMGSFAEEPSASENKVEQPPALENKVEEPPAASYGGEDGPVDSEEAQAGEDLLSKLNVLIDSDNAYTILLYGSGALVALWITTAIISALDSVPLFPKVMEIVGFGYTVWFSSRYLIFKKNRDELFAKVEELKEQVLGSKND